MGRPNTSSSCPPCPIRRATEARRPGPDHRFPAVSRGRAAFFGPSGHPFLVRYCRSVTHHRPELIRRALADPEDHPVEATAKLLKRSRSRGPATTKLPRVVAAGFGRVKANTFRAGEPAQHSLIQGVGRTGVIAFGSQPLRFGPEVLTHGTPGVAATVGEVVLSPFRRQ